MTDDPKQYVAENGEQLRHILRHSNDAYARACAWALLDVGETGPSVDQLRRELDTVERIA